MGTIISFNILVENLEAILGLYDHIQVFRAPAVNGTYVNITSVVAEAATEVGSVAGPWNLDGKTLTLALNSADLVSTTFEGTDPIGLADVIDQLNETVADLASESAPDSNLLRLTSALLGTGSSILASGTARSVLGLPSTRVGGTGPTILLTRPTTMYRFADLDGDPTFYYKYRFFSSITGRVSDFSTPMQGDEVPVLDSGALSLATINLVNVRGNPVVGRRIIFVAMSNLLIHATGYGVLPGSDRVYAVTDNRGHAELELVVGARVRVFIEGSQFFREIVVPATTPFDLLEVMAASPDPFAIVQAPPRPIRVS